jgi:2-dehydrotetronate isomerase
MLRFSANLGFLWSDLPLVDRIRAAARAGFGAVELHWPSGVDPALLRKTCRDEGVELLAFNSEAGDVRRGEFGLAALPRRQSDFAASIARAIAYAGAAGASAIHVLAGLSAEEHKADSHQTFIENMRLAAEAASVLKLTLLLEPMNTKDRPGYFYSTVDEVIAMLATIGRENVRLLFDVYHVAMTGTDVAAALRRTASSIGHIQLAGVPDRGEPDEGDVDFRTVFKTIKEIRYRGWVGCEYRPRTTPEAGLGWIETIGRRC